MGADVGHVGWVTVALSPLITIGTNPSAGAGHRMAHSTSQKKESLLCKNINFDIGLIRPTHILYDSLGLKVKAETKREF